ncbi:MAG: ABC transporter substrate-binding protein [Thermoplasmata archaeon]|nr:ABC transporter substrate-binding protein [Thermoplasmata archaeon]
MSPFASLRGRKLVAVLVSTVLLAALLISYIVLSPEPEPVRIGVIMPLTGTYSYMSEVRDTMLMAVAELNEWGGLNNHRIELVIADCESNATVAASEFERMEREVHPLAYISVTSHATAAIMPLAEEAGVVVLGIAVAATEVAPGSDWFFRYFTTTHVETETVGDIIERLDISSLGVLYAVDEYGDSYAEHLSEHMASLGGTVELAPTDCSDLVYTSEIAALSDNDAIMAVGPRTNMVAMLCQLNESGYGGHVLSTSGAAVPTATSLPEIEGVYLPAPLFYSPTNILAAEFVSEFHKLFAYSPTHHGACGYDGIQLIWGLLTDRELSRDYLRVALEQGFVFNGVMGSMKVSQGTHDIPFPLFPAVVRGGELCYL